MPAFQVLFDLRNSADLDALSRIQVEARSLV